MSWVTWLREPVRLSDELRRSLDAFRDAPPRVVDKDWGFFVLPLQPVTRRNYQRLTGSGG